MLNDVQTIVIVGNPSGTFQLGLDEIVTDPIPVGATPEQVQEAIGGKCTVELVPAIARVIITAAPDFFTLYGKNDFGNTLAKTHQYLPEYTVSLSNQPESLLLLNHTVVGSDTTDDVQQVITTGEGLWVLIFQFNDKDETVETTPAMKRDISAAGLGQVLTNNMMYVNELTAVTVIPNDVTAYRVTFPNMTSLPRLESIPSFTGGLYPFMTVVHTVVGGPILPDCCLSYTPPESVDTPSGHRVVVQRLTR